VLKFKYSSMTIQPTNNLSPDFIDDKLPELYAPVKLHKQPGMNFL
jgi:hypothetical protein